MMTYNDLGANSLEPEGCGQPCHCIPTESHLGRQSPSHLPPGNLALGLKDPLPGVEGEGGPVGMWVVGRVWLRGQGGQSNPGLAHGAGN